jgi:hypothetical protein
MRFPFGHRILHGEEYPGRARFTCVPRLRPGNEMEHGHFRIGTKNVIAVNGEIEYKKRRASPDNNISFSPGSLMRGKESIHETSRTGG